MFSNDIWSILVHELCKTPIHIGRDNNELFQFCPRCLIKIRTNINLKNN